MGIDKNEWGFRVGHLPHGERNKISDVPGVTVGHCTLADGDIQTGVTALLPHPGDVFHDKVLAACHVINGFGKTTGLVQIDELGTLETPILFTNTLSVGTVETALVKYAGAQPRYLRDHRQCEPGRLRVQRLRPERYPGPACHRGACGCRSGRLQS